MKLTDALIGEHGAFYTLFDEIERVAAAQEAVNVILGATTVLEAMIESHATLEDDLLFAALEPHLGAEGGPLAVMRREHDEMYHLLERIEEAADAEDAVHLVEEALSAARAHFRKEEQVLFPMASRLLGDETLSRLGKSWAEARQVTVD